MFSQHFGGQGLKQLQLHPLPFSNSLSLPRSCQSHLSSMSMVIASKSGLSMPVTLTLHPFSFQQSDVFKLWTASPSFFYNPCWLSTAWGKIQILSHTYRLRLNPLHDVTFCNSLPRCLPASLASSQQLNKSILSWFWTSALASAQNIVSEMFHGSLSFKSQSR